MLIGPAERIRDVAKSASLDIAAYPLIEAADGPCAAALAVALVRDGKVALLMKGDLHTDELMHAVVAAGSGLRTFTMRFAHHPAAVSLHSTQSKTIFRN